MDPATFQLILAGLAVGSQAMTLYAQARETMTVEQAAQAAALVNRISAAQALVTPYTKEETSK